MAGWLDGGTRESLWLIVALYLFPARVYAPYGQIPKYTKMLKDDIWSATS